MYSILRISKIKSRQHLAAANNHNLRLMEVPNANPEPLHKNIINGCQSYPEMVAKLEKKFAENNIKPRKDAVIAGEVILSASPEFFTNRPRREISEWLAENYRWLQSEFGDNILQLVVHFDESTPHFHVIFTPITKDGRLCMKDLYGGANKLSALQSRYAKAMEKFGLKRGEKGSKAKHETIKSYYKLLNKIRDLKPEHRKRMAKLLEDFDKENTIAELFDYDKMLENIHNFGKPLSKNEPDTSKGSSKFKLKL